MNVPDSLKSTTAGALSGLFVRFIISPLDVVKIRLQLQRDSANHKGLSITQTVSKIVRNEGLLAFWKGNLPAEMMYVVYGGVQFGVYEFCNSRVEAKSSWQQISIGGISGCSATVASYPLDTLRTRFAADKDSKFNKLWPTVRQIYRTESVKGFFEGLRPTILQIFMVTGTTFWSYNKLREFQRRSETLREHDSVVVPLSGFLAGSFAKFVTFPLDSLKRRLQIKGSSHLRSFKDYGYLKSQSTQYSSNSIFRILRGIVQVEGVTSLYRGLSIAILKTGPASSLTFTFYEFFMKAL